MSRYSQADVIAEISHRDGRDGVALRKNEVPKLELEKLLEDVRCVSHGSPSASVGGDRESILGFLLTRTSIWIRGS